MCKIFRNAQAQSPGKSLDDPQYPPAEEVIVHYGLLQGTEDRYGIDANAGKVLGEKLFSSEGL